MAMSTAFLTAYAKAPQNTPMYENNKQIGIMLEINKQSHTIVNVDSTFMTGLAKDYLKRMIIGTDFSIDISDLILDIEMNCIIPSQQALIVALKVAHQKYRDTFLKKPTE
ncbi:MULTISPECIES: DUF3870 domain-containing protein [Cytobacillus]|uniref:DUF3870 domain-containing protein n=1 Tax=Cytobacillus TaxID=2675230 RepID=UPI001CD5D36F|nr:DUF3870 domain-containing protein [Cytobacillus kochii]MCA1024619.1 DUF3870 domain-containing protein [Cytobacillus kochii]MCM3323387.1 DUF3870 domain-containing protein [Cytobacillus kochii]MCM3345782.1 DUF3870 domain-containing protein [Cytobacillus kochii]MDM5206304.1 DUF3870 domain-containing protein [Cytobacillus kochii]